MFTYFHAMSYGKQARTCVIERVCILCTLRQEKYIYNFEELNRSFINLNVHSRPFEVSGSPVTP